MEVYAIPGSRYACNLVKVKLWDQTIKCLANQLIFVRIEAMYSPLSTAHLKFSVIFKNDEYQVYPLGKADSKAANILLKWSLNCKLTTLSWNLEKAIRIVTGQ